MDDFSPARAEKYLRNLANPAPLIQTSAKSGDGMNDWLEWLRQVVAGNRLSNQPDPHVRGHTHRDHENHGHDHDPGQSKTGLP
jgi:hydrogenase nickel incorporation protein HypB